MLKKIAKNLKIYGFSELIILFLFSLVLVVPPFFYGGKETGAKFTVFALIFPLTYFIWKSKKRFELRILLPFILLAVFILGMGISIFYSLEKYQAIETLLYFLAYFFLFFLIFNFINLKWQINYFAYLTIGLGIVLSIWGLYAFISPEHYSMFSRIGSTFEYHIPFGEFFIYPLFLGLSLLCFKPLKRISKVSLILINSLFFITFFFIHSRGAWLSFLLISALLFLIFKKYIFRKEILISLIIITVISSIGIYGLYQLKSYQGEEFLQGIYSQETIKENVLTGRFYFWKQALEIFKDKPILGAGLESYIALVKQYLKPPFYYSGYAHSFYLKVLAEQGIILFSIFLGFIFSIIYYSFRVLQKIKLSFKTNPSLSKNNLLLIAMVGGIGSGMVNNLFNVGWAFSPANLLIFFFFSGIILKVYTLNNKTREESRSPQKIKTALIFLFSLILFFASWTIFISDFYFQDGKKFLIENEHEKATSSFQKALKFNPINPKYNRRLYLTYLSLARRNIEEKDKFLSQAEYFNKKTLKWTSNLPDLNYQGEIYSFWGKYDLAEESYKKSVESCPSRFVAYLELVKLYLKQNRYSDIHSLLEGVLSSYKKKYILSHLYMFPNKNVPLFQISSLHYANGKAYLNEDKFEEAKREFEKSIHYFPQNEFAKKNLEILKETENETNETKK